MVALESHTIGPGQNFIRTCIKIQCHRSILLLCSDGTRPSIFKRHRATNRNLSPRFRERNPLIALRPQQENLHLFPITHPSQPRLKHLGLIHHEQITGL
jgi:hypothetical protein